MCGRFTLSTNAKKLKYEFGVSPHEGLLVDRYNIAPGDQIPVIYAQDKDTNLLMMQWGLFPTWESNTPIQPINARIESVHEKPMFKRLIHKKRCLIPASGFYEWDKSSSPKQPYYFHLPNHENFVFAGLWDEKVTKEGEHIFSCVILTQQATPDIQAIHDRMPVILTPSYYESWLKSSDLNLDELIETPSLSFYPVSTAVNSSRSDHPDLIRPLT